MNSRDKILTEVAACQPQFSGLPGLNFLKGGTDDLPEKFIGMLTSIGGKVIEIKNFEMVKTHIKATTDNSQRVVSTFTEISDSAELINNSPASPHTFLDIELAIIGAELGVAENGAVWIKGDLLNQRVLPFICQHLAVILKKENIVATMHDAYEKINNEKYGFSTFIAGPSKTADIEQSLVLGAHGPKSMTVFLIDSGGVPISNYKVTY